MGPRVPRSSAAYSLWIRDIHLVPAQLVTYHWHSLFSNRAQQCVGQDRSLEVISLVQSDLFPASPDTSEYDIQVCEIAANLVSYKPMRKLFILVMAVSLAGLGQVSLSASALFSSNRFGCGVSKVRSNCDEMDMSTSSPQLDASEDTSCCFVSSLPAGEYHFVISDSTFAVAHSPTVLSVGKAPRVRTRPGNILEHDHSPPASQSRLCIFLI
jgi:hypothetical protein